MSEQHRPRLPCGKTTAHDEHEWRGPVTDERLWCKGIPMKGMGALDRFNDNKQGPPMDAVEAMEQSDHLCPPSGDTEQVEWEAVKLRQLAVEVPEYDWLTNSATLVRIAEEMAADKGWRLDDKRMPAEEAGDSPARLTLVWLVEDLGDKAKAWELLLERRLPETVRHWTYWLPKMAWDQQASEEDQDTLKEFALRMLRHEGYLVQGNCVMVEEEVSGLAVVGLRWQVTKRREVVDLDSTLV